MKRLMIYSALLPLAFAFAGKATVAAKSAEETAAQTAKQAQPLTIGGEPVVTLVRPANKDLSKPHFLKATVLPGRGMNLLQLKAYLPGKGEIDVISAGTLDESKQFLDEKDDEFGNNAFKTGTALLLPWANRVRGKLSADGKTIEAMVGGKSVSLPAGWSSNKPGAEKHSIHGLILKAKFQDVQHHEGAQESSVSALLHGGDFGGHWPSKTDVTVRAVLRDDALELIVTAKNVGKESMPMGIAFHPYFAFPSGDRKQAKLHLPTKTRALVNNYDDVFPTGELESVKGTAYDFTAPGGKALGDLFMDDNFPQVEHNPDGSAVVEIIDPAANYGLRMTSLSPEVKAVQVYAPTDKSFVAVEPQFNWNDPFNKAWGKNDTGMVTLKRGQSVSCRVRLQLFTPSSNAAR